MSRRSRWRLLFHHLMCAHGNVGRSVIAFASSLILDLG
jgi:hypothetical protein